MKNKKEGLSGAGRPFEDNKSYILTRLTKASQDSPHHGTYLRGTQKKFYGKELIAQGIRSTGDFWMQNPFGTSVSRQGEWWFLYEETPDGVDSFYDKGQFATAPAKREPKEKQQVARTNFNSGNALADQILNTVLSDAVGSRGKNGEMTALYIQQINQQLSAVQDELAQARQENQQLREKNQALEIAAGQFEVIKRSEVDSAVIRAKQEQQQEDEAMYKQLIEEDKKNKKGLGDMLSDPAALNNITQLAGMVMQIPAMIREFTAASREAKGVIVPEEQQQHFDANGNRLHSVAQLNGAM